ncbi:MAG: ribonuclease J [Lachnospiraceae bacterium]|nr:ribonuclease J [Lachnospiraceae bacterium]
MRQKEKKNTLHIIPLGGLEKIGMNMTAFEYGDSIIVVDCGLAFPTEDMPGIDLVIPDTTYLKDNISKVKGFFITHGHEDHIGAIPYVMQDFDVPVYATRLTQAIIEHKLKERGMTRSVKRKQVKYGQTINAGCFRVEFIRTNHSIADAAALAIFTPVGTIVHSGDFKVDYTPVFGDPIDLQRFAELGKKGVLALMADSTNAIRDGFTMSERSVGRTFETIFSEHKKNRILVATFASNVDRVQQVINTAYQYNRKVVVEGRSMVTIIGLAQELGCISIPKGTLIDIEELKNYPENKTVIITTGSQGESMAALSRMASDMHKKVSIHKGDVVVLSSTPIPGNEKAVSRVINELSEKGAEVIFQDTHVSGHACREDLKLLYSLLKPHFAIPVHGEYRHLQAQQKIALEMGIPEKNTVLMRSGDVLEVTENALKITGRVQAGSVLVDGLGIGDVGNIVLRDRQNLSQHGIMIVVLTLDRARGQVVAGPNIVSRGFVYVRESENLMDEAQKVVEEAVEKCLRRRVTDWGKLKSVIRDSLGDYLWKKMKRDPVILPIIMEI